MTNISKIVNFAGSEVSSWSLTNGVLSLPRLSMSDSGAYYATGSQLQGSVHVFVQVKSTY